MNSFWTNILRYPRFFISSLVGLILVILTPFRNLFKIPKLRIFLIILIIFIIKYLNSKTIDIDRINFNYETTQSSTNFESVHFSGDAGSLKEERYDCTAKRLSRQIIT